MSGACPIHGVAGGKPCGKCAHHDATGPHAPGTCACCPVPEPRVLSPADLWQQAEGDADRYRELMREHGHLIPGKPEPLPCGWPTAEAETCRCGRRPLEHGAAECPCPAAATPDDLCPACSAAFDRWWAAQVADGEVPDA